MKITPFAFQKQINNTIILVIELDLGQDKILVECARRWLKKLGYELTEAKKAMYVDGHEWLDVVAYCMEFLEMMKANKW